MNVRNLSQTMVATNAITIRTPVNILFPITSMIDTLYQNIKSLPLELF